MSGVRDKRVLVVGASSGLGRVTALHLSAGGARVAVAARRRELLDEVAAHAKGEVLAIACDVRDAAACEAAVARTVEAFAGLDALVYAAGGAFPAPISETDAEAWRASLDAHVVGAAMITRAALPHLQQSSGRAIYCSSIAADDSPPRPGMAVYVASKAAMNRMIDAWRGEHPDIGFTRLSIGDTGGTEFAARWSEEQWHWIQEWSDRGYLFGRMMEPERVAEQIAMVLANPERVPTLTIVPEPA